MSVIDYKTLRSRATDKEALAARARKLSTAPPTGLPNGIKLLTVEPIIGGTATLTLYFYNENYLQTIDDRVHTYNIPVRHIFPLSGGHRLPAGPANGMVQVQAIATDLTDKTVTLRVAPVGDYSTYKLRINTTEFDQAKPVVIDPLFNEIEFKFRPGCFNINCAPDWTPAAKPDDEPVIDYLAKDYDSFRHTMIAAMMQRVPNWQPSSEADLDQVLLELFSAAADELSDYQDRVMNEAYLSSARKRVSLARHARLMDYHIHQGNQASTWLALEVAPEFKSAPQGTETRQYFLTNDFEVRAPAQGDQPSPIIFVARDKQRVHELVNRLGIYTWGDAIPSLVAGDTTADLKVWLVNAANQATPATDKESAVTVEKLIRSGVVKQLLIQEHLNPVTGTVNGYNPRKRQLLKLLPGADGAQATYDPTTAPAGYDPLTDTPSGSSVQWFVRVRWEEKDELRNNYCFTVNCPDVGKVENVSLFHGNLVEVSHGRLETITFKEPGSKLNSREFYYERLGKWGTICTLPDRPLAYQDTKLGGDEPTQSTLLVRVFQPGGAQDDWDEVSNLIHSDDSDENGDHFVVETDEERFSEIRFGNGTNGKELPESATVECTYQVGDGLEGNIGLGKLTAFDPAAENFLKFDPTKQPKDNSKIIRCWNPFDVVSGRAPEPAAEIIRRVPEAYRVRQLRAVTLADYVKRAEELPEVSRAAAAYAWTGSWRTVRLTIDPAGTTVLEEPALGKISRHLNAVRLIGEDLEIRSPQFVPLEIEIWLCAKPEFWCEDLESILEQEFSDGWTPDGRQGFFHPDLWTFGQSLKSSQIFGRVLAVEGVEHIISLTMKRWNIPSGPLNEITVSNNEIIQVFNDKDHMETGSIAFHVEGGRR